MSTATETSERAVQAQVKADEMVAVWFKATAKGLPNLPDEQLEDHAARQIDAIRQCREFARSMPNGVRPAKVLADKIGSGDLKTTVSRIFKCDDSPGLGTIKTEYRRYLKGKGLL